MTLTIEPIAVPCAVAAEMLGIGRSLFQERVSRGELPRPRAIAGRSVWLVEELRQAAGRLPVAANLPPKAKESS